MQVITSFNSRVDPKIIINKWAQRSLVGWAWEDEVWNIVNSNFDVWKHHGSRSKTEQGIFWKDGKTRVRQVDGSVSSQQWEIDDYL